MAKDAYWFKHDSTAGRGLKMKKMQHIYGHEGKGFYWDVIEVLREQNNYVFPCDDISIEMLSEIIGTRETEKFKNWFHECIRVGLFEKQDDKFYSNVLCENMHSWETKKDNGSKGGRPKKTETITEPKAKRKRNVTIREEKRIEEDTKVPKIEEVEKYFLENGYSSDLAKRAYKHYDSKNWHDSNDKEVKNWKMKMQTVWFSEKNKGQRPGQRVNGSNGAIL